MELLEDRRLLSVAGVPYAPQTQDTGASSAAGIESATVGASDASATSNVLWQNQATGLVGEWLAPNAQNTNWTQLGQADPLAWQVVGVGKFNTADTTDVLWQNQSTGLVGFWRIQNDTNAGWIPLGTADPVAWKVVGVGDFSGTGASDVLWQNRSTGLVGEWVINNGANTGWVAFDSADPLAWKVVGVGDFNSDGTTDVLWQNQSTGLVGEWVIENAASTGWVPFGSADPLAWKVAGVGEFNGDGTTDVLWRNQSTGLVGEWVIQNPPLGQADWVGFGSADPTQWQIVGAPEQSGSPLLAASVVTAPTTGSASLTDSQLQPIIREAIARWTSAGLDAAAIRRLTQVQFVISDLPGSYLGETEGNRVYIDVNAAGNGWFVDPTPALDEEFAASGSQQQLVAVDPRAANRIDLLTVVEHELGHVAGLSDIYAATDDIMNGVLGAGVRRYLDHADAVLASS
jgi:hypothetical protein